MIASEKHYQGKEGQAYHEVKRGIPARAFPWVARLRAEKLQPHIGPGDRVFEYGVGSGWNLAQLNCAEKFGSDVSDFLRSEVEKHGIRFVSSSQELATGSVDAIVCHHVLEHVPKPPESLAEMKRILKPGGKLLLFVPFEKERRYRRFDPAEPNHHLYSWNVQTLANLVTDCGWRVESAGVGSFGYDRFAAQMTVRLKLCYHGFRTIRGLVHLLKPGLEVRLVARY
jgi:ubiquinone/menaquinone biosynthesis C-methylase UbiE